MRQSVFSIAPGLPFLKTLAEGVASGRFGTGPAPAGDPLALAAVTIYVPTRRAARSLAAEFARLLGADGAGGAAILPMIRPIGEAEEGFAFAPGAFDLAPTIDPTLRRMLLARFVRAWKAGLSAETLRVLAGEEIVLPASAADALWLARDLGALLDEAETEGVALSAIAGLAPERLADWWQLTVEFLTILTRHWPGVLADRGVVDEVRARNERLLAQAERLRLHGSPGPVILAGSTATAPATVALMQAVAGLANGALVLPGLDRHLERGGFDAIETAPVSGRSGTAPGHPQYGLKKILARLLLSREAVDHIAPADDDPRTARERFVSDALRPAETTEAWSEAAPWRMERAGAGAGRHPPEALDGLALVEAADERGEALAIACAMRDALSAPGATVALTTPDRSLARRVVAELTRFGIAANDSAGRPLAATAPGTLLSLALAAALSPGDPIVLVALLKHPLLRLGHGLGEARRAARAIETIALRGTVGVADAATLAALFEKARAAIEEMPTPMSRRVPRPVRLVPEADRDLGAALALRLREALAPLIALRGGPPSEIGPLAVAATEALEALAADADGDFSELYREEAGASLAGFLSRLVACPETGFSVDPGELPDVMAALLAGETVRPRGGLSARAFVWGALEARLQSVDTMILGGLNEGTWPQRASGDAFLSRLMRAEIALEAPERRIGLAAHDVTQALGSPRVVLTRSARSGGAPTIASRWLQRMLTLAGAEGAARLRGEGSVYVSHAAGIDAGSGEDRARATRPSPRPPVDVRPTRYSVTEIETLVRDPYAIHARRILRLEPMPPLIRDPGAADRGTLYHAILAAFVAEGHDVTAEDARETLLAIAHRLFSAEALPPEVEALWWPRMEALAANYVAWERERAPRVARRFAETRGDVAFPELETRLTGSADRIDVMADGAIEIIDFKTGTSPSAKQARTLLAPQLPLEGAMARLGAFPETEGPAPSVSDLLYVRMRERRLYQESLTHPGGKTGDPITGDGLSDEALARFRGLVAQYRLPDQGFASRPRPFLAGDFSGAYDHLARAREWSFGADEESVEEGE